MSLTCPTVGSTLAVGTAGFTSLVRSEDLCVLFKINTDGRALPVGRSYASNDWEPSAGHFHDVSWECAIQDCAVLLPDLLPGESYELETFASPTYTADDEIARFLEQTTFGTTAGDIAAVKSAGGVIEWTKQQIHHAPTTSHRSFYRKYLNSRFQLPSEMGIVTHPCQRGTKYRAYAFTMKDEGSWLRFESLPSGSIAVYVSGLLRTVVNSVTTSNKVDGTDNYPLDTPLQICRRPNTPFINENPGNTKNSDLFIRHPDDSIGCVMAYFNGIAGNTRVHVDDSLTASIHLFDGTDLLGGGIIQPTMNQFYEGKSPPVQELMLTQNLTRPECTTFPAVTGNPEDPVFVVIDGQYWIHDPRFVLLDNLVDNPMVDGGGPIVESTVGNWRPGMTMLCANAPRTFLNEDGCFLSTDPNACGAPVVPNLDIELTHDNLRTMYAATGGNVTGGVDGDNTRFVYAIAGLNVEDPLGKASYACTIGRRSRWIKASCDGTKRAGPTTERIFRRLFAESEDTNPFVTDIRFPTTGERCDSRNMFSGTNQNDRKTRGLEVMLEDGTCMRNVHPQHLNVYDMTYWTINHSGNNAFTPQNNPIKSFAWRGLTTLEYPSWHDMGRWRTHNRYFGYLGRLGDTVTYIDFPVGLQSDEIADVFSAKSESNRPTSGVIVCGSPHETPNDLLLSGDVLRGAFDASTRHNTTTQTVVLTKQRQVVWINVVLSAMDQLRQRMAWALSQILVISPSGVDAKLFTEIWVNYYDIFVRNAFGNYRDVLREVSYSPMMAEMLTYMDSKSTAFIFAESKGTDVQFPDENYAREILQLFSIGLYKLNPDGSQVLDGNGNAIRAYTNADIEEMARLWTGFRVQASRGNTERGRNRLDPMIIDTIWRDKFAKMGLDGKYIGDGYPLCADLPDKHFLKAGAKYRIVSSNGQPQLQIDPNSWGISEKATRLSASDLGGGLYDALCASDGSNCNFATTVILDSDVDCEGCNIDTIRTVEVEPGIFYEYIRPACVEQTFYNNPKKVVRNAWNKDQILCADPRTEAANMACCDTVQPCCTTVEQHGYEALRAEASAQAYWGERMTYDKAQQRCGSKSLCDFPHLGSWCDTGVGCSASLHQSTHYWASAPCKLQIKIDSDGTVAVVHSTDLIDDSKMSKPVQLDTKTYFRVDWGSSAIGAVLTEAASASVCGTASDGALLCDIDVSDSAVYTDSQPPTSSQDILDRLKIGAFLPTFTNPNGANIHTFTHSTNVKVHYVLDPANPTPYTPNSVFEVVDDFGVVHYLKNIQSVVTIPGTSLSFRNPPHFISLVDEEPRDAQYETEAALDHYFYHPNTAPFLALRLAQRFGHSNPSPRFLRQISAAFTTGTYVATDGSSFGSGKYGDLGATVAAILLDRESRNTKLDADPAHGALVEPLMKVIGLMRTLEFLKSDKKPLVDFRPSMMETIGQMVHEIPTVFSFFLPEYLAAGSRASAAGLVAPEAMALTTPKLMSTMNGMFSLLRWGLDECHGGFGDGGNPFRCLPHLNYGALTFRPRGVISDDIFVGNTSAELVDELATLLTAGRLSQDNRNIAKAVFDETVSTSAIDALIKAEQVIVSSPEFHSTAPIKKTGQPREIPLDDGTKNAGDDYKATVYLMLSGGLDSWNMLVPHTCEGVNAAGLNVVEQYESERGDLALKANERDRRVIAADPTKQPCSKFGLHPKLSAIEKLYASGDLAFFANAGVLNKPVDKTNYNAQTKTQLFAHNAMQKEAKRVDPYKDTPDTGILGRMLDVLAKKEVPGSGGKKYRVAGTTVDNPSIAIRGTLSGQAPDPTIVNRRGPEVFNPGAKPGDEWDVTDEVIATNSVTSAKSGYFGEIWSSELVKAIGTSDRLKDIFDQVTANDGDTPSGLENPKWAEIMRMAANIIKAHNLRQVDRDVVYVDLGGWDHHRHMKDELATNFADLNVVLNDFYLEMRRNNLWDKVNLVIVSDFGRTLVPNSNNGADHGWGGHYFMMGGSVKGGQIHGEYPSDITKDSELNIGRGRGRMIPTLSWESIWNGVAEHMGLDGEEELNEVLPNRVESGAPLFTKEDLFETAGSRRGLRG